MHQTLKHRIPIKHLHYIAHLIAPPLGDKINAIKQHIADEFGCKKSLNGPAHITFVPPFHRSDEEIKDLLPHIIEFAKQQNSFTCNTHNYNRFTSRTLFIEVVKNTPLLHLFEQMLSFSEKHNLSKLHKPFNPHITVANRDVEPMFEQVWNTYKDKVHQAEFTINALHLFRHNGSNWEVIETFAFKR